MAPTPPLASHEALKARAAWWLNVTVFAGMGLVPLFLLLGASGSRFAPRICLGVPFSLIGAAIIAIDLRLRFAAARYFVRPTTVYLLLNRDVGLVMRAWHAWILGGIFLAMGTITLIFNMPFPWGG